MSDTNQVCSRQSDGLQGYVRGEEGGWRRRAVDGREYCGRKQDICHLKDVETGLKIVEFERQIHAYRDVSENQSSDMWESEQFYECFNASS